MKELRRKEDSKSFEVQNDHQLLRCKEEYSRKIVSAQYYNVECQKGNRKQIDLKV